MKKQTARPLRSLRLRREALKPLTPDQLVGVPGGAGLPGGDHFGNDPHGLFDSN
jgi:hypothetical protein